MGEGVDNLAVGEDVAVPAEMGLKILGCFGHPRPDDEPQVRLVQTVRCADDSIPASATTTMSLRSWRAWNAFTIGTMVAVCLIALVGAGLEWEPLPIGEQPDHDLRDDRYARPQWRR